MDEVPASSSPFFFLWDSPYDINPFYFRALEGPVFLFVKIDLTFFDLWGIIKVKQHPCGQMNLTE
jgi:hypothetical protein